MSTATTDDRTYGERRQAAFHEAGHGVVSAVLGAHVDYATVEIGDDDTWGHMVSDPPLDSIEWMAVLSAGFCAESLACGPGDFVQEGGTDMPGIEEELAKLYPDGAPPDAKELGHACMLAMRIVRNNWPAVRAIANRLMRETKISGDDVRAIVKAKGRKRRTWPQQPQAGDVSAVSIENARSSTAPSWRKKAILRVAAGHSLPKA